MIYKILATVFTGIGGHYLNKRWDKAILFLCLFLFYSIFCWLAVRTFLFSSLVYNSISPEEMMKKAQDTTKILSIVFSSGILILWITSIIVTILDSKKSNQANIFKWTKSGGAAASLTTLLSLLLLVFTVTTYVTSTKSMNIDTESTNETEFSAYSSHNFFEYLYFGGVPSNSYKLPIPPTGKGVLKGRILYQNKPAEAVSLHIILNSKYRANAIVTDSNGIFTVKLPLGNWKINSIQTESWQNKPKDGRFTMYYGGEKKLRGKSYSRHTNFRKDGLPVAIEENKDTVQINITIKQDIKLLWPDASAERINASITDVINWEKYPRASQYYVEIKKLRREGTTTYYDQITSKILSNETAIPLSSLKHIKTKGKEKNEYAAEIYAFSEDGTLLGQFSDTFQGGTFLLADGHVLVEDKLYDLFDSASSEDPEVLEKKMEAIALNRRRVSAVKVLIDDNMIPEAEILLNLINSEYVKGQKEVLSGYILALQGECKKSNKMFDEALSINPTICIPDKYRCSCE